MRGPHDHRAVPVQGLYVVTATCLRATGLRFFQTCHCAELNKIVEATMPVKPFDDRKIAEAARKREFGHRTGIVYSS